MTETEKALEEIGVLLQRSAQGGRARGGSHFWKFHTSPTFEVIQWRPDSFRRIIGFIATTGINMALTKNAMGASGGGLGDSTGTALPEGSQVSANQVLFAGTTQVAPVTGLNYPVYPGETLWISKNQSASATIILMFDFD